MVARARILEGPRRTFLESERFDRVGARGRRHVVALDALHAAFVPGPRQNWASTCEVLARQGRLADDEAERVRALVAFGRLIGNSDMHFGNLSMLVARADLARGRFALAPFYDMLPMRWRPDAASGALDLVPFEPAAIDAQSRACDWAIEFWDTVAASDDISRPFRTLARAMSRRLVRSR